MLVTYHSNRLENLAERLEALLSVPLGSPFTPEIIVVGSHGMARWLSLRLADRLGICANVRFPFPGVFLWELFRGVFKELPATSSFDPTVLRWRLMDLLGDLDRGNPRFEPLLPYFDDADGFRLYELACRLAELFDQYLLYRPDWIAAWESAGEDHWQAVLWRRLVRDERNHRLRLQQRFLRLLAEGGGRLALPRRISLIGISALPPVYLELFSDLSELIDIHLFLLNPCREYWGEIVAERDIARRGADVDAQALYLEVGNPLLASLGKQGRDFIDLIQSYRCEVIEDFVEPPGGSLLACLQRDILDMRDRGGAEHSAIPISVDDRSLQVHACHSPMREVEVLFDQLLGLFEQYPDLQPAEVIVMTPDIDAYGPCIEAVFATAERRIPFSIADRNVRAESTVIDTFFALLDMQGSRYTADRMLALLENPALQRHFGFNQDDLAVLYRWVREVGIRWGIDPGNRADLKLPPTREHSWRLGLDRLLLGYALAGEDRLVNDILPYGGVEGTDAQLIGRLHTFAEAVFKLETELAGRLTLTAWVDILRGILKWFQVVSEAEESEAQLIRSALNRMVQSAEQAGFTDSVPLEVIKSSLRRSLETAEEFNSGRFLCGGVTFCGMLPMRSIPFQVICLLGLNDGSYPRSRRPPGFDLMAKRFRRGDRSRSGSDRYLFLETLLCARRCLYLSYVGSDIHDNHAIPPSVLVSELLDTIARGFRDAGGGPKIIDQLLTRHPLQAFSRRYFNGTGKLFSYSRQLAEASRLAGQGRRESVPFISTELPEPDAEWRTLELDQLIRFFANPSRYLLRQRLRIHLESARETLETREPFVLDNWQCYKLRTEMLSLHLSGMPLADTLRVLQGNGRLPHGQVGECIFQRERDAVERFARRVTRNLPEQRLEPLEVNLQLGDLRLVGCLSGVSPQGLLGYRMAAVKPRDYLDLWIRHLVLNALAPEGVERVSQWLGTDAEVVLSPLADPLSCLQDLLECYWQGLRRPLPFFPNSALAYVQAVNTGKASPEAAARRVWEGSEFASQAGEGEDPYYQLAFRGYDPLQGEFAELAERLFRPLLNRLEKTG